MSWQAKPEYAEHHRAAVERIVNALSPSYLLAPCSGELFDSLEYCNRRLRGWALAEGFDIVRNGGGIKAAPSYRFRCIFHSSKTKNNRKFEDMIERDSEDKIVSKRKKEVTNVRREKTAVTPSDDDDDGDDDDEEEEEGVTTVPDTPPRPISLAIRSPEAPPPPSRAPSPPELMTVSRSFPEGLSFLQPRQPPLKTCRRRGPSKAEASAHTRALQRCSCAG
jgi:hypothetical protein